MVEAALLAAVMAAGSMQAAEASRASAELHRLARRGLGGATPRGPAARLVDGGPSLRRPPAVGGPRRPRSGRRAPPRRCSPACRRSTARAWTPRTASASTCSRASCATTWPTTSSRSLAPAHQRRQRIPHRPSPSCPAVHDLHDRRATTRTTSRACAPSRAYVAQQIANMREGLRTGFTLPRVVLDGYDVTIRTHVVDDPEKSVFYAPFRALPPGVPESRARAAGRRPAARRSLEGAVAGYRDVPRLHDRRIPPEDADHDRGRGPAAGPRVLRVPRAALHDPRRHARGGPPDRARRGRAHPRRDGGGDPPEPASRATSRPSSSSCAPTRASTRGRRRSCSSRPPSSPSGWTASCRPSSARCRACPTAWSRCPRTSRRSTPAAATSGPRSAARAPARTGSTRTRSRAGRSTPRGADPARGRARPSPPDRAAAGAAGRAGLPPRRGRRRVRRGLGPLLRAARPRGRLLPGPVQQLRPAHLRDVARLPAGRGHRHARAGLVARAGDGLHGRATPRSRCTRCARRPTATSPGPARPSATRWAS